MKTIVAILIIGYIINKLIKVLKYPSQKQQNITDYLYTTAASRDKYLTHKLNHAGTSKASQYSKPELTNILKEKISQLKKVISHLEGNLSNCTTNFIARDYKISYSEELNTKQLEAVKSITGKILLIAGAGSGKTRTLTYRTSFLLENNISAEKIVILTFTKKAAEEIKKRVNHLLADKVSHNITTGTFHSFCNMLLTKYSKVLKINPKFTILDQEDSRDLIDLLKKQSSVEKHKDVPFPKKSTIQSIISVARNRLIAIEDVIKQNYPNFECYTTDILELTGLYNFYKKANNLYDYDDLINEVITHLKVNYLFKEIIHKKYKYIMVDEYQDTNLPQKELIDLLAEQEDCSLAVVGDDNQSIYAFRGANYQNILLFGETYPNAKLIKLEQNYRSTPYILDFINSISDNISLGYKKSLFSNDNNSASKPEFIRCTTETQEGQFIADKIIKSKERLDYKEMAVLCRNSANSNFVQAEFLKRNIPFIVIGGIKFIEKRHVKDILAYMKILWNSLDTISWHRILTILEGVGSVTSGKIIKDVQQVKGSFTPLSKSIYVQKNDNIRCLYEMLVNAEKAPSLIATFDIIEKYYIPVLKKIEGDWKNRIEDFKVLKRLCAEHGNLASFLSNLALDPPNDSKAVFTSANLDKDAVTISTIHSAKGLEWNTVFVISLIDGIVPHYKSFDDYEQLEEERKLFYVACSRAKENLYLTAPAYFSTYNAFFDNLSRFIDEVNNEKYLYREIAELYLK